MKIQLKHRYSIIINSKAFSVSILTVNYKLAKCSYNRDSKYFRIYFHSVQGQWNQSGWSGFDWTTIATLWN